MWSIRANWKVRGYNPDEIEKFLISHIKQCEICGNAPGERALAIDHCHSTHKLRGLLCGNCNNGLGRFQDDPALLRKAAEYLETH